MSNESALRDGNGEPTMLFEQGGETRRVSDINPLPVTANVTVNLPVTQADKTTNRELTGNASQTLMTPTTGKKLTVKGCAIMLSKTNVIATLRFQGGQLVSRVKAMEHSGNFIPMIFSGAVNEPLICEQTNAGGADTSFFIVNYIEE